MILILIKIKHIRPQYSNKEEEKKTIENILKHSLQTVSMHQKKGGRW